MKKPGSSSRMTEPHVSNDLTTQTTSVPPQEAFANEITPLNQLLEVSRVVMSQALSFLDSSVESNSQLCFVSRMLPGSTIGKHIRHAHAHFMLLLDALEEQPCVLNYDIRKRDTPMETDVEIAKTAIQNLQARLNGLKNSNTIALDDPLILNAVTPDRQVLQSTFGRELWFAALHAVHHWSMVRVVATEQSLEVEGSFGVAPSTLLYRGGSDSALSKAKI